MEAWERYLKREKTNKNKSFRDFGSLSGNGVVTDIYNKKYKKQRRNPKK